MSFYDAKNIPECKGIIWQRFPLDNKQTEIWLVNHWMSLLNEFNIDNNLVIPIRRRKPSNFSNIIINTDQQLNKAKNPNSDFSISHKIEQIRRENISSYTINDLKIDPDNQVLDLTKKSDRKKRRQLVRIARKYSKIFRKDGGCVMHPQCIVNADIDENISDMSSNKRANYLSRYSDDVKDQLRIKLNRELADGILMPCSVSGVVPANILPIFPVAKKCASGDEPFLHVSGIRLVSDCSLAANKFTRFRSHQGDDIRIILQKVAKYTELGLLVSCDIADCFHAFRLHPNLYKFFCLDHPDLGVVHYTRLPQGWLQSPSASRDFLHRIFYNINEHIVRYVDDLLGGSRTWDDYIELIEKLFGILEYHNLRIKGSKTQLLGTSIEFLGRRIKDGIIYASPHHIERLDKFSHLHISTKKQLKQFLGLCAFISEHKPHASTILHPLRRLSDGNNKDPIYWNKELIETLENVKSEMSKLIGLHPIDPDLDTYVVCDTSYVATGACLYQKIKMGESRIIAFFSRKRADIQNKTPTSSCILELSGIAAAISHFHSFLVNLKNPVIVFTDSKSAVSAYKKFTNSGELSQSMKISSFLAALHGVNYKLEYIENTSSEIMTVDYLSRNQLQINKECDPPCKVCKIEKFVSGLKYENFLHNLQFNLSKIKYVQSTKIPTIDPVKFEILQTDDHPHEPLNKNELNLYQRNYDFDQFWKIPTVKIFSSRCNPVHFQGNLDDLMNSTNVIINWQNNNPLISNVRRLKRLKLDPTTSSERTLMITKKAFLENDVLKISSFKKGRRFNLIVLPDCVTENLFDILHQTIGHNTYSAFKQEFYRLFFIQNSEKTLKKAYNKCIQCQSLGRKNRLNRNLKSIPLPEFVGEQLLLDEFSRQSIKGETWRFLFVTDSLSRFSKIYPYEGQMNKELFIKMLSKINIDFCATNSIHKKSTLHIRCDKLQVHVSSAVDDRVKNMNIKLDFHESFSNSKNSIAELDGRLAKISRILNLEMQDKNKNIFDVANSASLKYNCLRGFEGYSPREIWVSRDLYTNKQLYIDINLLKKSITQAREASKACMERKVNSDRKRHHTFIEFDPVENNDYNKEPYPLKIGDIILVDTDFIKDNLRPYFQIICDPGTKQGINWDEQLVYCRKMNTKQVKTYIFQFSVIKTVIDGNSSQAKAIEDGNIPNNVIINNQVYNYIATITNNPLKPIKNPLFEVTPLTYLMETDSEDESDEIIVDSGFNSKISNETTNRPVDSNMNTPISRRRISVDKTPYNKSPDSAYETDGPKIFIPGQLTRPSAARRRLNMSPIAEPQNDSTSSPKNESITSPNNLSLPLRRSARIKIPSSTPVKNIPKSQNKIPDISFINN